MRGEKKLPYNNIKFYHCNNHGHRFTLWCLGTITYNFLKKQLEWCPKTHVASILEGLVLILLSFIENNTPLISRTELWKNAVLQCDLKYITSKLP